jgi:hypothetical protein
LFGLIQADPPAEQVRRVTFLPFLPDGRCVLIEGPEGPVLSTGDVLEGARPPGQDYLATRYKK